MQASNEIKYHQSGRFSLVFFQDIQRCSSVQMKCKPTDRIYFLAGKSVLWKLTKWDVKDFTCSLSPRGKKTSAQKSENEVDPIRRQFTQWQSSLSRVNSVNCTYTELCRKWAGDHYVTSAVPPSTGKIIARSTAWLAPNEQMWVTMSFSLGAAAAWGSGRSWIWNNETVNGLHHCYWFLLPLVCVLCWWPSDNTVATRTARSTCACSERRKAH